MKTICNVSRTAPRLATLFGLMLGSTAPAFPPAPHHTLYGMVRNQWGDPINVTGAEVRIQSTNGVGVAVSIATSTLPGVNYQLIVPMDSGTKLDLYQSTALRRSQPFQLKVKIGNTAYIPIEMVVSSPLGKPGGSTRLDFTLGVDSDGDRLPDVWEQAILAMIGGTLADITPNGDADGDGISNLNEFLAGTYAFDPSDGFQLTLRSVNADASTLEFFAIRGRTYRLQASSNLQQWTPVAFRVINGGVPGALQSDFWTTEYRQLQIEVPFQPGSETNRYFRAMVQ